MKTSDIVINKINRFKSGFVFTYKDFSLPVNKVSALKKVLNRLVESGKIERLSKGKFYKPIPGMFGMLKPDEYQVVKDLLKENGKEIGYLTGISMFNKLGLTTQISNTIQIGTNIDKKSIIRGKYNIRFIRQRNKINKDNYYLLQILDTIKFIKRIPDANENSSFKIIMNIIQNLSIEEKKILIKLALRYNSATRALTGAILEILEGESFTVDLYNSLKPTTVFSINISENILKNKKKWMIQ